METQESKTNGHARGANIDVTPGTRGQRAKGGAAKEAAPNGELAQVRQLSIPAIETAVIDVHCVGTKLLIIKAWSKEARSDMLRKQMGLPVVKRTKDPHKEFMSCRYLNKKGQDYLPGHILKKCLVSAAELVGVKRTLLEKILFVLDEQVLIICPGGPVKREDMVRNRGRMGSVADIRFRPEYTNWSFKVRIEYHRGFLTPEAVLNLFQNAGYSCGLGEGRPQKGGEYGRFRPTTFKTVA